MPELPDVVVYVDALRDRLQGRRLERFRLISPFVLRTVTPPLEEASGRQVQEIRRLGKRIAIQFEGDLFVVFHLMIAGRLRWRQPDAKLGIGPKLVLARFEFDNGTLVFSEAGSKKRASIQVVRGEPAFLDIHRGGLEPLSCTLAEFEDALRRENHTLKRGLTDPTLFSGIGNAYSDEILHAARLSPLKLTRSLTDEETSRLYDATRLTLTAWIERLRADCRGGFPEKVTAFHEEMAVHGRYRQPCPVCGTPVQRIVYAENECNYCATCQTEGKLLADRSLSRLLKDEWPRSLDEWDAHFESRKLD
jgi:formamidopyrimidine-DNA glycosylase